MPDCDVMSSTPIKQLAQGILPYPRIFFNKKTAKNNILAALFHHTKSRDVTIF
jgi:hypothetical protein